MSWQEAETIEDRIEIRLQVLEHLLVHNQHISDPDTVDAVMRKLRPHYNNMTDPDKLYMDSAERIITEQIPYSEEYDQ